MHQKPRAPTPYCSRATAWRAASVFAWVAIASGPASAAEFCVTCETPSAHYNCVLPGPAADPSDTRLKLWCITELAKAGGHASCSVDRQQQAKCEGAVKAIALPNGYELGPAPAEAAREQTPPAATAAPPAEVGHSTAQTVIPKTQTQPSPQKQPENDPAITKKASPESDNTASETAAQAAGSTLNKAGKAVGDAAQKTWTCITSLFGDC